MERSANDRQLGRAMGSIEDFDPIGRLQFANLFGDCWLRKVQYLGGGRKTSCLCNRVERAQLGVFHRIFLL
jgi:hypothetical protein